MENDRLGVPKPGILNLGEKGECLNRFFAKFKNQLLFSRHYPQTIKPYMIAAFVNNGLLKN